MDIKRHFTVTVLIVCKNKVLLHRHKKLGIWIPVGGHVDENELPEVAAIREAKEETGLDIKLFNSDKDNIFYYKDNQASKLLIKPAHIELHKIKEGHFHINLVYFARTKSDEIKAEDGREIYFKWFNRDELNDTRITQDVRFVAKEALEALGD